MKIEIGLSIKSSNGYVWIITQINGKKLLIESNGLKETITVNDLKALVQIGHYTII